MKEYVIASRKFREQLLRDPYRPCYHFAIPDDNGSPGDPNGAFFADGVYHLMYLYHNADTDCFHWGHMASLDLVHWRHLPDALKSLRGDQGCFSGGAFLDDDGTAYLTFWKFPSRNPEEDNSAIAMARSTPPYEVWERMEPVAIAGTQWGIRDVEIDGEIRHLGCADPSNIWKADGFYYMQTGNLCVLNEYGRKADSPAEYRGGWTELFRSKDLKTWEFVHRFYENTVTGPDWPDATEDDMCPSFLPLYDRQGNPTGKHLQIFISHNKGCQYFVGVLDGERFTPQVHGRMTWNDNTYFAPEALVDDRRRQILWTWCLDDVAGEKFPETGWAGVYALPRKLWWENNQLRMAPVEELEALQFRHQVFENGLLNVKNGQSFRLKVRIDMENQNRGGIRVKALGDAGVDIYWDKAAGKLVLDAGSCVRCGKGSREDAPLCLEPGENLSLDIFVDKSVVEVFANEKQAIYRTVYPENPEKALGVSLIGRRDALLSAESWEMFPANPF